MYDAVCISRKFNSDAIAARQIKIESLFIYNEEINLDYRVIERWRENLLSSGCFTGQSKFGRPENDNKLKL
uniref:HTH_48 domain-containing protein n=1 Tax=Strongyloides stercoralis TaxID=6248 RepID=A0A0K0EGS8_STRER